MGPDAVLARLIQKDHNDSERQGNEDEFDRYALLSSAGSHAMSRPRCPYLRVRADDPLTLVWKVRWKNGT
jgi:hypothetical protein